METTIISILTYILEACIELLLIRSLLHRKWKDMFSFYLFLLPVCGILDYCFMHYSLMFWMVYCLSNLHHILQIYFIHFLF